MSVLIGGSVDEAIASLPAGSEVRIADVASKLRDSRRAVRAQGLALVGQEVAVAIGEMALR